jgi:hypothetical protein
MPQADSSSRSSDPAAVVLGYLNFSSGGFDAAAWRAMSDLFRRLEPLSEGVIDEHADSHLRVAEALRDRLAELASTQSAFLKADQARGMLEVLFQRSVPAYREYHRDLLEHQPAGSLERPFFLMALAQAILAAGGPGDDAGRDRVVAEAIDRVNDYMGWRPVAVLENGRLSEPYPHERVRPIPVYIAAAGAAHGRFHDLATAAIDILAMAPAPLLRQADFDLTMLEELAFDPRAFDFLHPAASRPNYLFGLWDPALIDERGCYRRMVVQQATLEGILSWGDPVDLGAGEAGSPEERRLEAAAVLAGVMLMASGLSGHGPGAPQAALPLADLLPRIAAYRDEFYRWLLGRLPAAHRRRLAQEAELLQQPFGGVRRHINAMLSSRRARQVESVTLASILSRLGRRQGAEELAGLVPAASARMLSRITGQVVEAQRMTRGVMAALPEPHGPADCTPPLDRLASARELLGRAIGCGAIVDPWNILGLAGQFPLHEPGGESLPDPRIDDLVAMVMAIMEGYAAVWRRMSLAGDEAKAAQAAGSLDELSRWWDQFASTSVSGVPYLNGREIIDSTREVVAALMRRRAFAPQPPPAGFWRQEVAEFSSSQSHSVAAEALLREGDLDGAMGLLVHWASLLEGDEIELSGEDWLTAARRWLNRAVTDTTPAGRARVRRFLDLIEANIGEVADLIAAVAAGREPAGLREQSTRDSAEWPEADDLDEESFDADESVASAYESMVWRDSTADGNDSGMLEREGGGGNPADAVASIERAAVLLGGVCGLFRHAVTAVSLEDVRSRSLPAAEERDVLVGWRNTLRRLRRTMAQAAGVVNARDRKPAPGMTPAEFDRLRWQRDATAERLIEAALQATEAVWMLSARIVLSGRAASGAPAARRPPGRSRKPAVGRLFAAIISGEPQAVREELSRVSGHLEGQPVLYVPLSRGGRPERIVTARMRERLLERLAGLLPRLGLVTETVLLVRLAKSLESRRPAGGASVSEFDRVFESATRALVGRIVVSARTRGSADADPDAAVVTQRILDGLATLIPKLLETWTTHARQLRLSVLERLREPKTFATTQDFIERYGAGLFSQHLLTPPSLRGILRGGVRPFLEELLDHEEAAESCGDDGQDEAAAAEVSPRRPPRRPEQLLRALRSGRLSLKQAASRLRVVLESVAENHAEYRDWNSTTTHSDRGECLHILLDFLRIKAEYDRIAWTLRPVGMAHRVLVEQGAEAAAEAWRQRMQEETGGAADELAKRLLELERRSGVRLASITDRVRRPFTAMLEQDELETLVLPAVDELLTGEPAGAGDRLERKARSFLGVASGSGVEIPVWLERLSATVDQGLEAADVGGMIDVQEVDGEHDLPLFTGILPDALPWQPLPWEAFVAAISS